MRRTIILSAAASALSLLLALPSLSQTRVDGEKSIVENTVEFDKTVHDFGDILLSDGPVMCTFTVKNVSSKPIAINSVVSSCGCTNVEWTREPLAAGKTGKISATFSNDQGAYPFDKSLTVYVSGLKKPVILRLRGTSHDKKKPLTEIYPVSFGSFSLKETDIKLGNLNQGSVRSDAVFVANTGTSPAKVTFANVSPNLQISVSPNPIPAGQTAKMTFTVTTDRKHWGKNYYYATPVVNGKEYRKDAIGIWAFTKEDFSNLTKEERNAGSQPMFAESTVNVDVVKQGTKLDAVYKMKNDGKSELRIYKIDTDYPEGITIDPVSNLAPGKSEDVVLHLDTSRMPKKEFLIIVTLTTNSPLRPLVNLFISGAVK